MLCTFNWEKALLDLGMVAAVVVGETLFEHQILTSPHAPLLTLGGLVLTERDPMGAAVLCV